MLLTLETDSSHSRPHSSCLLRQLPLGGGGEHEEAEGGGGGELRAGGEDVKGEGSSRRHRSSLQRQRENGPFSPSTHSSSFSFSSTLQAARSNLLDKAKKPKKGNVLTNEN